MAAKEIAAKLCAEERERLVCATCSSKHPAQRQSNDRILPVSVTPWTGIKATFGWRQRVGFYMMPDEEGWTQS